MANEQNLAKGVATQFKSGEQAAEAGRRGGIASGKSKRAKKSMQELAKLILDMPYEGSDDDLDEFEGISYGDAPDKNLTVGQRSLLALAKKAMKGDAGALAFLRDTAGEKPVEKVEVSGSVEAAATRIRELMAARKADDGGE